MPRIVLSISQADKDALQRLAAAERLSVAALLRRLAAQAVTAHQRKEARNDRRTTNSD